MWVNHNHWSLHLESPTTHPLTCPETPRNKAIQPNKTTVYQCWSPKKPTPCSTVCLLNGSSSKRGVTHLLSRGTHEPSAPAGAACCTGKPSQAVRHLIILPLRFDVRRAIASPLQLIRCLEPRKAE